MPGWSGRLAEPSLVGRGQCSARSARAFDLEGDGARSTDGLAGSLSPTPDDWFGLYQLAEKLVDIDDALAAWRHKHVLTVERIIGNRRRAPADRRARPICATTLEQARLPRTVVAQDRIVRGLAL